MEIPILETLRCIDVHSEYILVHSEYILSEFFPYMSGFPHLKIENRNYKEVTRRTVDYTIIFIY